MNALIIEDSKSVAAATKKITEAEDYKTTCFSNATKALEWLKQNTADLMVVDYKLPDMTGKEFIEKVAAQHHAVPPFIVSTGKGSERVAVEMMRLGAKDYVMKDQMFQEMLPLVIKRVTHAINEEKWREKAEDELARSKRRYQMLAQQSAMGVAIHKIITNQEGEPIDYQFVEANNAFNDFTGLKPQNIVGKTVREVIPNIEKTAFDWIGFYGKIALEGTSEEFEQFSEPLSRWYKVYAYSTEKYYFTTIFTDTTLDHIITESSQVFNSYSASSIDYEFILKQMQRITGAKYATLNIFDENKEFTTTAITGINENIKKATAILGFQLVGKKWKHDPDREEKISTSKTTIFKDLGHLTGKSMPGAVSTILKRSFNLGQIAVIKSLKETEPVGDFTLIFEKGITLQNQKVAELFADLTGMLIARVKAESADLENRHRYESLVNNIPGITYRCKNDPDWTMIFISKPVDTITGYTSDELLNNRATSYGKLIHKEDKQKVTDAINTGIKTRKHWEIEYRVTHKSGTIRWVYEKGMTVYHEKDEVDYLDGFIFDITEKKAAEEAKFKQTGLIQSLLNSIPDFIFYKNLEGKYMGCNPAFAEHVGRNPEEITGLSDFDLYPKELAQFFRKNDRTMLDSGKQQSNEEWITYPDGRKELLDTIKTPYRDANGKVIGVLGISHIITRHKQTEQRLDTILSNTPAVIYTYRIDKQGNPHLTYINDNVINILGFKPKQFIESIELWFSCVHPEDIPKLAEKLAGKAMTNEYRFKDKQGKYHWLLDNQKVLRHEDDFTEIIGTWWDITHQKEVEQSLSIERKRLQSILEGTNVGTWEWNVQTGKTIFNDRWAQIVGYEIDELLPTTIDTWTGFAHPDDLAKSNEVLQKHFSGKLEYYEFESRMKHKDGHWVWVLDRGKVVSWTQDHQPLIISGTHQDITRRKIDEQRIQESEKLQRSLLENIAAGIMIIDPETRKIEIVNKYAQQLIGLPEEEILGRLCHQFVCPAHEECCPICDKSQDVDNADKKLLTATGKEIPILKTVKKITINGKEKLIESFVEITEKKATEELLIKSAELLKNLSRQIPGVIYQYKVNPDGNACFPFASENIYEVYEVQPHEVKTDASPVFKRLHPGDYENVVASISKSRENLTQWEAEYRVILPKKGERWLRGTANPEKLEDGSVLWHGYIFDYTEIKEIQLETEKAKKQFELAVAGTNDGIWDWDIKTNALFLSKRWKDMLGYEDHELKNHLYTFFQLVYAEDMPALDKYIQAYLSGKIQNYSIEFRMKHKDGSLKWILAKGEALRDRYGVPYRMAGSHSDITQRRQMEEQLRENSIRLELAMDAGEHGFWDWNLITDNTFFSPTYYTMLGYEDQELPMNLDTFMKLVHPEDAQKVMPIIQQSIEKATSYEVEFRLKCKDGSYKWVMGKGKAYFDDQSGKPTRAVGVHIDIDGRKRAENELIKKNKMLEETTKMANTMAAEAAAANAAKSEFLANMSHEIRTPMNSILGFSEIMFNTTNDKKQKNYLNTILDSGQTLLSLINDILDLSKIEAGKMDISYEPIDLRMIIADIRRLFSQNAEDKNIELITEIDENFPHTVLVDEIRLRQILLNITGNAIKFTNKGYVKITLTILNISNDNLGFEIAVEDTGIGVAPQQQSLIFESFRQASGQDSRQYSGTGLGLSISKKLVELMNGEIRLSSTPGKGSTFTIVFQNIQYSKSNEEKQLEYMWNDEVLDFRKQKVLLIDDVAYNRQLVEGYLENNNLLIYEAENGALAIEAARNYQPDLILMDLRMPVMDGYHATRILKQDPDLKNIPVVALTASTMKGQNEEPEKLFNGILHKPVKKQALIRILANHLKHKKNKKETWQTNNDSKDSISSQNFIISEEVRQLFNEQFAGKIEDQGGYVILDELDTLLEQIKEFTVNYKVLALQDPLEKIQRYRDDFDLTMIQQTLHTLKNLFR